MNNLPGTFDSAPFNWTISTAIVCALVAGFLIEPVTATERSRSQRELFIRTHPCPSTGKPYGSCPRYIVDHVVALACGGPDAVENMQWQSVADACEKDKWELRACGKQH